MFYCYWWFTIISIIIIIIEIKMIITIIKGGEWMVKLTFFFSSFTSPETYNNKKMQINIRDQVSS